MWRLMILTTTSGGKLLVFLFALIRNSQLGVSKQEYSRLSTTCIRSPSLARVSYAIEGGHLIGFLSAPCCWPRNCRSTSYDVRNVSYRMRNAEAIFSSI